jgi:hypothetical protein
MEVSAKGFNYKSKQIISVQTIFEMTEVFEAFSIFIYYETTVREDPLVENYRDRNNI